MLQNPLSGLSRSLKPLVPFLVFVIRRFPLVWWIIILTLILIFLEYSVLSLMIPLASDNVSTNEGMTWLSLIWDKALILFGLSANRMTWLWIFLTLLCVRTSLGYLHLLLSTWVAKQVHSYLSERNFRRVLIEEPITEIYRRSIGYYLRLAGDDTFRAGSIVLTSAQTLANLTSVIVGFAILFFFSYTVFVWTMLFLLVCGVLVGIALQIMLKSNARSVEFSARENTMFVEAINGLRSIRSLGAQTFLAGAYSKNNKLYVFEQFKIEAIRSGIRYLPGVLALFAGAVSLWPGSTHYSGVTASFFFAAITLLIRIFVSLGSFVNSATTLLNDLRAANDISEVTGYEPPKRLSAVHPINTIQFKNIELCGIDYGYMKGHDVLSGLNLSMNRGQVIAVIGPSGSGKSTLADLLLGLVQARSGIIKANNIVISAADLGRHVVLVEQQARIFSSSVRENILLGFTADDELIWKVLKLLNLDDYVHKLPGQLDHKFNYQGANLSGGQKQRLSIARALVRRPSVLILDEATSALDSDTRNIVINSVREFMSEGIMIMITHDTTLVLDADIVCQLSQHAQSE